MKKFKILVIGLGNPILGDDGIGWHVLSSLPEDIFHEGDHYTIDKDYFAEGGLRLMELMLGYDFAVIIDAITTKLHPQGWVCSLPLEHLPDLSAEHITSPHNTSLQTSIHLGRQIGLHLPSKIFIVGIETSRVYEFSEELTLSVKSALPIAINQVKQTLNNIINNYCLS